MFIQRQRVGRLMQHNGSNQRAAGIFELIAAYDPSAAFEGLGVRLLTSNLLAGLIMKSTA